MNSRRSERGGTISSSVISGQLLEERLHANGALMRVLELGIRGALSDELREVPSHPRLHDGQLVGQEAVHKGVRAAKLGHNIAQLGAADQVPVPQGGARRVIPELHVPHDPAQQPHVGPPDEASVPALDLGEGLDIEAELHLLRHGAAHVGKKAVQRIDEEQLPIAQRQRAGIPFLLPVEKS